MWVAPTATLEVVAVRTVTERVNTVETGVKLHLERHADATRRFVVSLSAANPLGSPELAAERLPELICALSDLYLTYRAST